MKGLKVENWQQWEELTCYLLQHFVKTKVDHNIEFQTYGSRGQSQYGIDLVSKSPQPPQFQGIVGQSKLKETTLTWSDVHAELKKTDNYTNTIRCYVLFTTANYHTTIQDVLNNTPYYYTRPNGDKFRVFVIYFSDYKNLSFVPENVLSRLFPSAFSLFQQNKISRDAHLASIQAMKDNIPRWLDINSINWLDTWDFSCGFVKESDFQRFFDLWLEYDRTNTALNSNSLMSWINEGDRIYISKCLPAANDFFVALTEFKKSISDHIIAAHSPAHGSILTLDGLHQSQRAQIISSWRSSAANLSLLYKKDILGQNLD